MKQTKLLELRKRLHEVEFKCSQQELYEYLIAKYTIEYSQNDKSKQKLKCIPTNAYFICEFFEIEYIEELDATIERFYSNLTNPNQLFMMSQKIINQCENKSVNDEIVFRREFSELIESLISNNSDDEHLIMSLNNINDYINDFKHTHDEIRILEEKINNILCI
jgi:hypothetical protein